MLKKSCEIVNSGGAAECFSCEKGDELTLKKRDVRELVFANYGFPFWAFVVSLCLSDARHSKLVSN